MMGYISRLQDVFTETKYGYIFSAAYTQNTAFTYIYVNKYYSYRYIILSFFILVIFSFYIFIV